MPGHSLEAREATLASFKLRVAPYGGAYHRDFPGAITAIAGPVDSHNQDNWAYSAGANGYVSIAHPGAVLTPAQFATANEIVAWNRETAQMISDYEIDPIRQELLGRSTAPVPAPSADQPPTPQEQAAAIQPAGQVGTAKEVAPIIPIYNPTTDHGGPDPIQGYDVEIWVQRPDLVEAQNNYAALSNPQFDTQLTMGGMVLLGKFTSGKIGIRTSSEQYMEYDSRAPIQMDGESQIVFQLTKGLVDMDVFRQTFGVSVLGRRVTYNLLPRLNITININTVSFDDETGRFVSELNNVVSYGPSGLAGEPAPTFERKSSGRFVLKGCKVDAFDLDFGAGKQVAVSHWTGVADELVSLPGDPPQAQHNKQNEPTNLTGTGKVDGAWDSIPAHRSNTRLPAQAIQAGEQKLRSKLARARQLQAIGFTPAGNTAEQQLEAIDAQLLLEGRADTRLPISAINASERKMADQLEPLREAAARDGLAEPPWQNTALPVADIMARERDRASKDFLNRGMGEVIKGAAGLTSDVFDRIQFDPVLNSNLSPDQRQQAINSLPAAERARADRLNTLMDSVPQWLGGRNPKWF